MTDRKRRVLILVPGEKGGIARLFAHLGETKEASNSTIQIKIFVSHDTLPSDFAIFPIRVLKFLILGSLGRFDLCHINLSIKGSTVRKAIFGLACGILRIPYVIHLHGSPYENFYHRLPGIGKTRVSRFFKGAARILILGTHIKDFIINELGVDQSNVVVLPNAVAGPGHGADMEEKEQPARILFLGKAIESKGVSELVEALASPALASIPWTATIAGDGEFEKYRGMVKALGLHERVDVPGWLGAAEVRSLLRRSSILALPSHSENQPLSMLEGMAFGLCPVVTPVGAVEDVIHDGENGILVPVGKAEALAGALARLLREPGLRATLAANARRDFEAGHDISDYREKLEAIYCDALDQP